MEPYQLRVIEERDALEEKTQALYAFISSKFFTSDLTEENQELLKEQYYAMKVYLSILDRRIKLF